MSRDNRFNEIELNFDGLTDSVTNLVGALILLVVLVYAFSHEAGQSRTDQQAPASSAEQGSQADMVRRIELMGREIRGLDSEIGVLEQEVLPRLRQAVTDLSTKAPPDAQSVSLLTETAP